MTPRLLAATAARVVAQLRGDHRTVAMLLVVPPVLMTLLYLIFENAPGVFDRVGPPLLGLFPFITMFLVTSVTMLRERTTGTLERLMTMPLGRLDLLGGYGVAFGTVAAVQATIAGAVAFGLLGLEVRGSELAIIGLAVANALLGMALGLFISAFAKTEFQAVQFMPAVVLPQLLLCGLIAPRAGMADVLDAIAAVLPLTYAYQALRDAAAGGGWEAVAPDLLVVVGATALALVLGAATLRRTTA